jgi:hypothetical protein
MAVDSVPQGRIHPWIHAEPTFGDHRVTVQQRIERASAWCLKQFDRSATAQAMHEQNITAD